jgi:AraC-like DNA-binding protein
VHVWKTTYEHRTESRRHELPVGLGHALLAPLLVPVFGDLGVSASVWEHGPEWWSLHGVRSIEQFEIEHGKEGERSAYNMRWRELALSERRIVRASFRGYTDLFVPLSLSGATVGLLVVGPIATKRPTPTDVLECWREISGRQGHPSDPEFAWFLSTVLQTLVLNARELARFERLLGCMTRLMSGQARADRLMTEAEALQHELVHARFPEQMWRAVRQYTDDRAPQNYYGADRAHELHLLGATRVADHVVVGLTRSQRATADPVDEMIRRHELQRACVELAYAERDVLCGQVGDHGVLFLSGENGSATRKRAKAQRIASNAARLAARFGFALHSGLATTSRTHTAAKALPMALGAAEEALAERSELVVAKPSQRLERPLVPLRRELQRLVLESPAGLESSFEHYLEAVAVHSGYRVPIVATHLQLAFEQMAQALLESGALDAKGLDALGRDLRRAEDLAMTTDELFVAYRHATAGLARTALAPVSQRRERGLGAAVEYMREHYGESLRAPAVAKIAGFAPKYFSRCFKQHEGVTFEHYLRTLRLERAKRLLTDTGLDVEHIARLSGFSSAQYFCRVFRNAQRSTPLAYRRHALKSGPAEAPKKP